MPLRSASSGQSSPMPSSSSSPGPPAPFSSLHVPAYAPFPGSDALSAGVALVSLPRELSTVDLPVPQALLENAAAVPPHIRDCLFLFNTDWSVVHIPNVERGRGGVDGLSLPSPPTLTPMSFEHEPPIPDESIFFQFFFSI